MIEILNHMTKRTRRSTRRPRRAAPRRPRAARPPDTRDRILDAAERLFAARGYDAVSIRSVLAAAHLNVSLVHYHFGGRDGLLEALLRRRLGPITGERLRRLAAVDARGRSASLEDVLRAYFEYPPPEWLEANPAFSRLIGQLQLSPSPRVREIVQRVMREAFAPLGAALAARAPAGLDAVRWTCRLYFVLGVWGFAAMTFPEMARSARKHYGPGAVLRARTLVDEIVAFCAAGLRSPAGEERP